MQNVLDQMKKILEESGEDVEALVVGSDHPHDCRCEICLRWWKSVGPEIDEDWEGNATYNYGPFTKEEFEGLVEVIEEEWNPYDNNAWEDDPGENDSPDDEWDEEGYPIV
jgi:hypothetical protein